MSRRRVSIDIARTILKSRGNPVLKLDSTLEQHFIATGYLKTAEDWTIIKPGIEQNHGWVVVRSLKDYYEDPDSDLDEFGSPLAVRETETQGLDAVPRRHSM